MDKRLVSELLKTRKSVKRKYESLKSDIAESQLALQKQFNPISQPLQELISTLKTEGIKKEVIPSNATGLEELKVSRKHSRVPVYTGSPKRFNKALPFTSTPMTGPPQRPAFTTTTIPPQPQFLQSDVIGEIFPEPEELPAHIEELDVTEGTIQEALDTVNRMLRPEVLNIYLDQYEGLARQYIEAMIRDTKGEFDQHYGVRFNIETDKYFIGNKEIHFNGSDMFIMDGGNKVTYEGTPGFYELMFKKKPIGYTEIDQRNYYDIVKRSAAHRKEYDPQAGLSGNVGPKYTKIIRPLTLYKGTPPKPVTRPRTTHKSTTPKAVAQKKAPKTPQKGSGLLNVTNKNVEFVPWKNPNTLVDRLQILIASQLAGHTGHNNEIVRIIDALTRAKIIKSSHK